MSLFKRTALTLTSELCMSDCKLEKQEEISLMRSDVETLTKALH